MTQLYGEEVTFNVQRHNHTQIICYMVVLRVIEFLCILYLLHLYPGFYSYTEEATWKILDLLTETLLI